MSEPAPNPDPPKPVDGSGRESPTSETPNIGGWPSKFVCFLVLVLLLGFAGWLAWDFRIGLLPLVLGTAFCAADVLVFLFKPKIVRVGGAETPRVFSLNLRLIASGALLGLGIIGFKWIDDAFDLGVGQDTWTNWHWALRLLLSVLFTSLVALGIARLAKED